MKYKVTTSYLIGAGDMSHEDEWLFDTRGEAQRFLDKFYEAFPKEEYCMDYPYIPANKINIFINRVNLSDKSLFDKPFPEIEEVDDTCADPYAWLDKQIKKKEEYIKKYRR